MSMGFPFLATAGFSAIILFPVAFSAWVLLQHPKFTTFSKHRGRIEGVLYEDGKVAPAGTWIGCCISRQTRRIAWFLQKDDSEQIFSAVMWNEYVQTDSEGRFVFDRIPEGHVEIGRAYGKLRRRTLLFGLLQFNVDDGAAQGRDACMDCERAIEVKPGKSATMVLGTGGTKVCGQFTMPAGRSDPTNYASVYHARLEPLRSDPEKPAWVTPENHAAWWADFIASDAGQAWKKTLLRSYHVHTELDGRFTINNVAAGTYALDARFDQPDPESRENVRPLGDFWGVVSVDSVNAANNAQVQDLGELPLAAYTRLKTGDRLPDLSRLHNSSGHTLNLDNYRGKLLLVVLFFPYCIQNSAIFSAIKQVAGRDKDRGVLAALLVCNDEDKNAANHQMRLADLRLSIASIERENSTGWLAQFGVRESTCFLADPDGKLVGCEIPPHEFEATVAYAMEVLPAWGP